MNEKENVSKKRNLIVYGTITVVSCVAMLLLFGFMVKTNNRLKGEIKSFETEILYKDSINYKKNYIITSRIETISAAFKLLEEFTGYTEAISKTNIKTTKQFNELSEQYESLEQMKGQIKELIKLNINNVYNVSLGYYDESEINKFYNEIKIKEKEKERKRKLNELRF